MARVGLTDLSAGTSSGPKVSRSVLVERPLTEPAHKGIVEQPRVFQSLTITGALHTGRDLPYGRT